MDNAVQLLLRPGTVALAVLVVIATFFIRRICEMAWPSIKMQAHENDPKASYPNRMSEWWNKVILYAISPASGGLVGIAQIPYIFPEKDFHTLGGRVVFGVMIGWFSSFIYKVFRRMVAKQTGVELPSNSIPPNAPPPEIR